MFKHSLARCLIGLYALLIGTVSLAHAEASLEKAETPLWMTVSNKRLDKMRGGFDLGLGMIYSQYLIIM